MEWYRIANLIMQATYMPLHLALIVRLIAKRRPTPVWRWFIVVVTGLWIMISGRFLESAAYMFIPSNAFYTFAVYYQIVGTSFATSAYLIWNLYLAEADRLSSNRIFKIFMMLLSLAVSLIVCTNGMHGLFYERLIMGEQVVHGKLFLPCLLIVYGTLFIGWLVSVVHIIRHGKDKIKRLTVFSLYPILPAAAALIRSITGVDKLDYMPIIMTASILCLYLMVFRYRYVDIISQSVEAALEQTEAALFLIDADAKTIVYQNKAAKGYGAAVPDIIRGISEKPDGFETEIAEKTLKVSASPAKVGDLTLVTVTDISVLANERAKIECEIEKQNALIEELKGKKRDIDAYLDSLYEIPRLKEKAAGIAAAQSDIIAAFEEIKRNFETASGDGRQAEEALTENIRITQDTIASVRKAVADLRAGV